MTLSQELSKEPQKEPSLELIEGDIDRILTEGVYFGRFLFKREKVSIEDGKLKAVYNIIPEPYKKSDKFSSE